MTYITFHLKMAVIEPERPNENADQKSIKNDISKVAELFNPKIYNRP